MDRQTIEIHKNVGDICSRFENIINVFISEDWVAGQSNVYYIEAFIEKNGNLDVFEHCRGKVIGKFSVSEDNVIDICCALRSVRYRSLIGSEYITERVKINNRMFRVR